MTGKLPREGGKGVRTALADWDRMERGPVQNLKGVCVRGGEEGVERERESEGYAVGKWRKY